MDLTRLPPGDNPPETVFAIVEIPRGGRNKFEYDPKFGLFRLDRVLYSSVHYPAAYGFIPGTRAEDGDPMDILVLTSEPTFTGCLIKSRPVGLFRMKDEEGEDEKVLAVPIIDPHYDEVQELEHIGHHFLREVENFFSIYKELEGKSVRTLGWDNRQKAMEAIKKSMANYA